LRACVHSMRSRGPELSPSRTYHAHLLHFFFTLCVANAITFTRDSKAAPVQLSCAPLNARAYCVSAALLRPQGHCAAYRAIKQMPGGQAARVGLVHQVPAPFFARRIVSCFLLSQMWGVAQRAFSTLNTKSCGCACYFARAGARVLTPTPLCLLHAAHHV